MREKLKNSAGSTKAKNCFFWLQSKETRCRAHTDHTWRQCVCAPTSSLILSILLHRLTVYGDDAYVFPPPLYPVHLITQTDHIWRRCICAPASALSCPSYYTLTVYGDGAYVLPPPLYPVHLGLHGGVERELQVEHVDIRDAPQQEPSWKNNNRKILALKWMPCEGAGSGSHFSFYFGSGSKNWLNWPIMLSMKYINKFFHITYFVYFWRFFQWQIYFFSSKLIMYGNCVKRFRSGSKLEKI